jgi:hypothetical protein
MTYVDGDFQSPRHLVCRGYGPNDHGTRVERGYSGSMERERQRERHREIRYARDAMETMASQIFSFHTP